jgi:hypothetical protein
MKRALLLSLVLASQAANADGRHTLVLKAEGTASADTRSKVDVQVLKLAKSLGGNVDAGEVSFGDATTMVGCNPSESSCKDQVLETLGVDEIVVTSVDKAPAGALKITVRRIAKTGMPSEQTTTVPAGQAPDAKLNSDIGPMFGAVAAAPPKPDKPSDAAIGAALGATAGGGSAATAAPAVTTPPPEPATTTPPAPVQTAQADTVTAAPNNQVTTTPEDHVDHRRLELTGMAVGGGFVLLSLIMFAEASSTQSDIDAAPTRTPQDFKNLQDLESQADTYAGLGNVMFIGGLAVAGVSTYFWWRDRKHPSSQQARIAPAVFDHGAGLTLSFGGGR